MYRLYYDRGSANMAPHAILEEIGAPHALVRVDKAAGDHRDPAYLALNPHARVPTLVDGDLVIYEAAAICEYLCDRHPEAGLAPAMGSPARGHYYQWLMFLSNTVQETLMHWYHTEHYAGEACMPSVKAQAGERVDRHFGQVNRHLEKAGPYLVGDRFSACDIYLTMLVGWTAELPHPAARHPRLEALAARVGARPAYRRMLIASGS
jgi:glutathione S-transferase